LRYNLYMPRASIDDYILSFRFHVYILASADNHPVWASGPAEFEMVPNEAKAVAGFSSVSGVGAITTDSTEAREGNDGMPFHIPGLMHTAEVTLTRLITYPRTAFWRWLRAYQEGYNYRVHLLVATFSQSGFIQKNTLTNSAPLIQSVSFSGGHYTRITFASTPRPIYGKGWIMYEAFITNFTPPGTFDGLSSDYITEELTIMYEYVDEVVIKDNVGTVILHPNTTI